MSRRMTYEEVEGEDRKVVMVNAYKLTRPIRYYCPWCDLMVAESPCEVCGYEYPTESRPLSDEQECDDDDE